MSANNGSKIKNFELDLLPVISVMSVCICFLLLTAVWTNVGAMEIEQGLGQESTREDSKSPSLWITMQNNGQVKLAMMDAPSVPSSLKSKSFMIRNNSAWTSIEKHTSEIKRALPELKTALIMPADRVNYGDVIKVMDQLKVLQIGEVGIAPL